MKFRFPFLWNPSIGLEIGEHSVRVVVLDRWFKHIQLVTIGEEGFSDPLEISESIHRLFKRLNFRSYDVSIQVSGKGVRHHLENFPQDAVQTLEASVKRTLSKQLPHGITPSEVVYGYRILGKTEKGIRVLISFCRLSVIDGLNEVIQKAGLNPVYFGAGRFDMLTTVIVTHPELLRETVCILDCEEDGIQVYLIQQGNLIDLQTTASFTSIPTILPALVEKKNVTIDRILLTGEKANNQNEILQAQPLTWPVIILDPLNNKTTKMPDLDTRYTLAIGLALASYYPPLFGVDLLPHDVQAKNQERRDKKKALRIILGLGWLLCLVMAVVNICLWHLQGNLSNSEDRVLLMQDRIVTAEMAQKEQTRLSRQLKDIKVLLKNRSRSSEILEEISRLAPQSVWLSEMQFGESDRESITKTSENLLKLSGWALSEKPVTQYVANLETSPMIQAVRVREILKIPAEDVTKMAKGINRSLQKFSIEVVLSESYTLK